MHEPIDPEAVKELIWAYRSIATARRDRRGDPRNMGQDEYENNIQAGIYEAVANDLERLLR